jgi:hypothetical protein
MEDYRQKLGNCKKLDDQTNVEFVRENELLFEKWLTSQEVTKMFNKLSYNVINPFEVYKQCVHSNIRTYLSEHKVSSLAEASIMTNALTHK